MIAGSPLQAPANPMSASQNKMYTMLSRAVIAAAEKMPEESYSFKPTPDVRSFGQLVGHLAVPSTSSAHRWEGKTKPSGGVAKSKASRAELIAALEEAVAY